MRKEIKGILFRLPMYLLMIGAVAGGFYAAVNGGYGITMVSPIILLIILMLAFVGEYVQFKKQDEKDN